MYREWEKIANSLPTNPFTVFADILSGLDIDVSSAMDFFTIDFQYAKCRYTDENIEKIFRMVYMTNHVKYKKLVAITKATYNPIHNYDMTETSTDTRTPDLKTELTLDTVSAMTDTRQTTTDVQNATTTKLNQSKTTTENPQNFTETTTHSVNPYDNPGFQEDSQDISVQSGNRTVTESYSGNADETGVTGSSTVSNTGGTETKNTGSNTSTETGTETTNHTLTRSGNIGVTTTQKMIEAEISLADKMNIFRVIEQDIAAKIFFQVW